MEPHEPLIKIEGCDEDVDFGALKVEGKNVGGTPKYKS